jgi:bacterioferritin (cytochrome b1)
MRTHSPQEAALDTEGKPEGAHAVVAGRIEELRHLEACERALSAAFAEYARVAEGGSRLFHVAERHRRHAELLAARIAALGGETNIDPDDAWIMGPVDQLDTLIEAERKAHRTYHDHLVDLDPDTKQMVRDRLLPDHEDTLEELTGERELVIESPELS